MEKGTVQALLLKLIGDAEQVRRALDRCDESRLEAATPHLLDASGYLLEALDVLEGRIEPGG